METSDINSDYVKFILFLVIVTEMTLPFSSSFVHVFTGDVPRITWSCRKTIHRLIETSPDREEGWWNYSRDLPIFNGDSVSKSSDAVSYTHLRAHETDSYLVCRLLL